MKKKILLSLAIIIILFELISCGLRIGRREVVLVSPENEQKEVILVPTFSWNLIAPIIFDSVSFDLYLSENNPPEKYLSDIKGTYYELDKPLRSGKKYYWKVVAKIGNDIVESDVYSFNTVRDLAPTTPTLKKPEDKSYVSIDVSFSWTKSLDPDGDDVYYDIYISTDTKFSSPIIIEDIESTGLNVELLYNTSYYWKVIAKDTKGLYSESNIFSFVTKDPPPIEPIAINPEDGEENVSTPVTLKWIAYDPEGQEVKYDVFFGDSLENLQEATSSIGENYYEVSNVNSGKYYYWKIRAKDSSGNVSESKVFKFKTQ